MAKQIVVIAHNIRSTHNIGSLFRTAEGLGVEKIYLTGYTPYPKMKNDSRMPHLAAKITRQIHKTALGAEDYQSWQHQLKINPVIEQLKKDGYEIVALEQTKNAINLPDYKGPSKVAIILGREVEGIEPEVLELADKSIEIPMLGKKESLNVVQAAAMALYHLQFNQ